MACGPGSLGPGDVGGRAGRGDRLAQTRPGRRRLAGVVDLRVGPYSVLPVWCSVCRREGSLDRGRHVPQHQLEATCLLRRQAKVLPYPALDLVECGVYSGGVLGQGQPDHAGVVGVAVTGDQVGLLHPSQHWCQRGVVEAQRARELLDGTRSGAAEHDQHEVLRVGQAVLLSSGR